MKPKQLIITFSLFFLLSMGNCQVLDTIGSDTAVSPETFLKGQHWIQVPLGKDGFIFSQPSSTFFVYFLSLFYIYAGFKFWTKRRTERSQYFWALGFFLTGVAALLAGTSYQALGYELKCSGRDLCRWTTWWEINYEILQNAGMNGFLIATAYTNASNHYRKLLVSYALLNTILYTILVLYGAFTGIQFLVSFEFLELSCLPSVLIFIFSSLSGYLRNKDTMNAHLLITWLLLIVVMIAYVVSLDFGITARLWSRGIWFSENDVLHVGLILWVYYIVLKLPRRIQDLQ
jgi:hypothetical protein